MTLFISIIALIVAVLVIYSIVKLIKRELNRYEFLFAMALTILPFSFLIYIPCKDEYVRARVTTNSKYSIGYVIRYAESFGPKVTSRSAKMYVELNGEKKAVRSSIILNNKYKSGEINNRHFLVAYDSLDTEYCVLLFDYPINDSLDYYKYLEQFKAEPLDLRLSPWLSNLLYKKSDN